MATKAENIVTLQALAVQLGRPVDTTGTAAEIAQRVAEWQEEAAGAADIDDNAATGADDGAGAEGNDGDNTENGDGADDGDDADAEDTGGDNTGAGEGADGEITQDKLTTTETKPAAAEPKPTAPEDENRLVLVAMLQTAHLAGAFDVTGKKKISIGVRGQRVHVPQKYVASLRRSKFIA